MLKTKQIDGLRPAQPNVNRFSAKKKKRVARGTQTLNIREVDCVRGKLGCGIPAERQKNQNKNNKKNKR